MRKISENFISSVLLVKHELPNLECSKPYRIGLSQTKIPSRYSVFGWLHFKWYKIFIYDGWWFYKVWMGNFIENKKAETIVNAFKQWLTSYLKPKILNTDNGREFKNKVIENYLKENNIDYNT